MEKMTSELKQGWDFTSNIMGGAVAAQLGSAYISEVEQAIEFLTKQLINLKNNQSDAVLGGFVAEYWHASTFNINAVASGSKHRAWVDEAARRLFGSVDIDTNFGKKYSSKYMSTAEKSAVEQSLVSPNTGRAKYANQERLVPSDQVLDAKDIAMRRAKTNEVMRPNVAASYKDTADNIVDTVSDGKISSNRLSKKHSLKVAREIKSKGKQFSVKKHGISVESVVKPEYIFHEAVKSGVTSAAFTAALQLTPEIFKAMDYLVKTGRIDVQKLKKTGEAALSSGAESYMRGSISASVLIMCRKGLLGDALRTVDPTGLGTIVAVIMETVKHSIMVAAGKMTPRQMGNAFVDSVIISGGFVASAKIGAIVGGAIGKAMSLHLPVVGYVIGSLLGATFAVTYNIGKKKLISICVDTGFTCFGLVEQNYVLPEAVLKKMGIDVAQISKATITRAEISRIEINTDVKRAKLETVNLNVVRRGVIGVNKIGYVL